MNTETVSATVRYPGFDRVWERKKRPDDVAVEMEKKMTSVARKLLKWSGVDLSEIEVGEPSRSEDCAGWKGSFVLNRELRQAGKRTILAEIQVHFEVVNPRDGEGMTVGVTLKNLPPPAKSIRLSAAHWCGAGVPLFVAAEGLSAEEFEELQQVIGKSF